MPLPEDDLAERHHRARPGPQAVVLDAVREAIPAAQRPDWVLDVGCATGAWSRALRDLAGGVVGLDRSGAMLRGARRSSAESPARAEWVRGRAEQLPFPGASFDMLACLQALPHVDRRHLFEEARRVLRPGGWLLLGEDAFTGRMREDRRFHPWWTAEFVLRFPRRERPAGGPSSKEVAAAGFERAAYDTFGHEQRWDAERFVDYLATRSDVLGVLERGESLARVRDGLLRSIEGLLGERTGTFEFRGWWLLLRRR